MAGLSALVACTDLAGDELQQGAMRDDGGLPDRPDSSAAASAPPLGHHDGPDGGTTAADATTEAVDAAQDHDRRSDQMDAASPATDSGGDEIDAVAGDAGVDASAGGPLAWTLPIERGLVVHLSAASLMAGGTGDGDRVVVWPDSSGNGYHAHSDAAAAERAPVFDEDAVGGLPGVRFDGADDHLDLGAGAGFAQALTVAFVLQIDDPAGTNTLWSNDSLADPSAPIDTLQAYQAGPSLVAAHRHTIGEAVGLDVVSTSNFGDLDAGPHVIMFRADGVSHQHELFLDGVRQSSELFSFGTGTRLGGILGAAASLGGGARADAQVLAGALAEVIMYARRLSDAELITLRTHLIERYSSISERPAAPSEPLVWVRGSECETRAEAARKGTVCRIPGTTAMSGFAEGLLGGTGVAVHPKASVGMAGLPALRFDPDDDGDGIDDRDRMALSGLPEQTDGYTISLVADVQEDIGQLLILGSSGNGRQTFWGLMEAGHIRVDSGTRSDESAPWSVEPLVSETGSVARDEAFVVTLVATQTSQALYLNGAIVDRVEGANAISPAHSELGFSSSRFHLYEVLAYRRALDASELDQLHAYLGERYLQE